MPGYVIHMAVASRILEEKGDINSSFQEAFLLGNIIPDAMDRSAKKESHFWDDETYKNLNRIPNVEDFLKKYGDRLGDPFILGYYTHLLLDYYFVRDYWHDNFQLLNQDMKLENGYDKVEYIKLKKDNNIYEREAFLSDELYYGDYDRIYPYIFDRYPYIRIDNCDLSVISVDEIDREKVNKPLLDMITKMNKLYDSREDMVKKELKVFALDEIYELMDYVVNFVCDMI